MLVLSRKSLVTVDNKGLSEIVMEVPASDKPQTIVVTLIENRGDKSRLGVAAPKSVAVLRSELVERIGFEGRKPAGEQPLVPPEDCGMPTKGLGM